MPPIIIPAKVEGKLEYSEKKRINILRVESDRFKICEPNEIKTKRHLGLLGEITWVVHVFKDGKFRTRRLN